MELVQIKEHKDLARDIKSMAVVNTKRSAKLEALAIRRRKLEQTEMLKRHEEKLNNIEKTLSAIMEMLATFKKE